MVVELNGLQFGANYTYNYIVISKSIECMSLIWNHKFDFRPKLHDMKFIYHLITSILKLQNSVTQIQDFFSL